jgi:hypothetical protein
MEYNFIDAPPGAGKTQWAIDMIQNRLGNFNPVMMVVPTIDLCNEIERRSNGNIIAIHSQNSQNSFESVQQKIYQIIDDYNDKKSAMCGMPQHIVITEASFLNIEFSAKMHNWIVIKDEAKEPLAIFELNVIDSYSFIKDHFMELYEGERLLHYPKPIPNRKYKFTNRDDSITGKLAELNHYLRQTDHYEVLIDMETLDDTGKLRYSVYMKPEIFDNFYLAYFMAASFKDTFLYNNWKDSGVEWIDKTPPKLRKNIRSKELTIHCLFNRQNGLPWSKNFREGNNFQNLNIFIEWINSEVVEDYVWVSNNSIQEYVKQRLTGVNDMMPNQVHGLNKWRDYTSVVLMGSYNSSSDDEIFYQNYNSTTSDIFAMRTIQNLYQQLTRTDIRNYDSTTDIHVYVPTLTEALGLVNYFDDAKLIDYSGQYVRHGHLKDGYTPKEVEYEQPTNDMVVFEQGVMVKEVTQLEKDDLLSDAVIEDWYKEVTGHTYIKRHNKQRKFELGVGEQFFQCDKGSPHCAHFILLHHPNYDTSGMPAAYIDKNVKPHMRWMSAAVLRQGATRLLDEDVVGGKFIGFDLDGTTLTDREISMAVGPWEYLQYTTPKHKESDKLRRLRIIVPFSRAVDLEEFERIKWYYFRKFLDVLKEPTALDKDKSNPGRKLFVPTANSILTWVRTKGGRKVHPLYVEKILARLPKKPKLALPTDNDIEWEFETPEIKNEVANEKAARAVEKIYKLIDEMKPRDRSHKATQIGGRLSVLPFDIRDMVIQDVFNKMEAKGCDKAAIDSARKYANKKN